MRILFLTPSPPRPDGGGAAIRNWYLIRAAQQAGHSVAIWTFGSVEGGCDADQSFHRVPAPHPRTPLRRLRVLFASTRPDLALRLHSQEMARAIANELAAAAREGAAYDICQVEGLEMWGNLDAMPRFHTDDPAQESSIGAVREPTAAMGRSATLHDNGGVGGRFANRPYETGASVPRIIYDAHNAEATLQQRTAAQALRAGNIPGAAYSLIQWRKLRFYERNAIRQAAATLAVSPSDAAALERLSGRHVDVVPIGVDTARYRRDATDMSPPIPFDVVFSGTLDYRANTDAARWLLRAIWPRIRAATPDATLAIVGRNPPPAIQRFHGTNGVTVTGDVPDDRPYIAGAGVYVLPIRFGAGVRVKLLNAMSVGCAVVATEMACEGVDARNGEHLLATHTHPGAFAAAVVALLDDPERRARLGAAARELMVARYDWSVITPALLAVYERLGAGHG